MNAFKNEDHQALADIVHELHKNWIVSYDNHEFILNLFKNEKKVLYQLSQCASNRIGDEVIIFDNRIAYSESILKLNSPIEI